jgi:hypothetical protein
MGMQATHATGTYTVPIPQGSVAIASSSAAFLLLGAAMILLGGYFLTGLTPSAAASGERGEERTVLGYLERITPVQTETGLQYAVRFDDIEWLSGTEAQHAALAAGLCTRDAMQHCAPDGYFVKNADTKQELLTLAVDARVTMLTYKPQIGGGVKSSLTLDEYLELISAEGSFWKWRPYKVTIKDGVIIAISEWNPKILVNE